jgi:hypothetical protein
MADRGRPGHESGCPQAASICRARSRHRHARLGEDVLPGREATVPDSAGGARCHDHRVDSRVVLRSCRLSHARDTEFWATRSDGPAAIHDRRDLDAVDLFRLRCGACAIAPAPTPMRMVSGMSPSSTTGQIIRKIIAEPRSDPRNQRNNVSRRIRMRPLNVGWPLLGRG